MADDEGETVTKAREQAPSRERMIISVLLTVASISLASVHLLVPRLQVDAIIIALLVVAILPWLGTIFQSIEWGGWKMERVEVADVGLQRQRGLAELFCERLHALPPARE